MPKVMVSLSLVLAATAWIPALGQIKPSDAQKPGNTKQVGSGQAGTPVPANQNQHPTPNAVTPPLANDEPPAAPQADKPKEDVDIQIQRKIADLTAGLVWVGAIQALALIGTLGIVCWQAILMRKHAEHLNKVAGAAADNAAAIKRQAEIMEQQARTAEDAAKTALLSTQAVINSERPWIVVTVRGVPGPMGGFSLYVRNKGRSPALVTGVFLGCAIVKNIDDLPLTAEYSPGNVHKDALILPGERKWVFWFDNGIFKKLLKDKTPSAPWGLQHFVFGRVPYRDLANPDKTMIHETRWIGIYEPPIGDEGGNTVRCFEGVGYSEEYECYK